MKEQLRQKLVTKRVRLEFYKKNIVSNSELESEVFILQSLYSIYEWVRQDQWSRYVELVNRHIGSELVEVINA